MSKWHSIARSRFAPPGSKMAWELDWDYFPPLGVEEDSQEWLTGYRKCIESVNRWYADHEANHKLKTMMHK